MISVKYFATKRDDLYYLQYNNEETPPISPGTLYDIQGKIKKVTPIFNYANFYGNSIDIYDESIMFGDESDYYGLILSHNQDKQIINVSFYDIGSIENGITIVFNKYSCGKIVIERNGEILGSAEAESGKLLSEKVYIDFTLLNASWSNINIIFSQFADNAPINIQGIVLGKIVDIKDIMSFDMISEINPIGDDLAINETNISAVVTDDFYSEEGQKIRIFDNDNLLENTVLKSSEEPDIDFYNLKSRNEIETADNTDYEYLFMSGNPIWPIDYDWNNFEMTVDKAISRINDYGGKGINIDISKLSEEIKNAKLSVFLPKCKLRKVIQQIAWACCCGIDTTYKENITLVPFLAHDDIQPDIVINNSDDRILKTSVKKGTKYSKIIWTTTRYFRNDKSVDLGEIQLKWNPQTASLTGDIISDEPFIISSENSDINDLAYHSETPYYSYAEYNTEDVFETYPASLNVVLHGYKYDKYEHTYEISTESKSGETLEIKNQILYPLDEQMIENKISQLKKWYSRNNTLSATVVDNNSEIKLGKVIKLQLKRGNYFQGIITKIVRNNIGDYHTVDLEAHEWI